jgi:hypothetical protein
LLHFSDTNYTTVFLFLVHLAKHDFLYSPCFVNRIISIESVRLLGDLLPHVQIETCICKCNQEAQFLLFVLLTSLCEKFLTSWCANQIRGDLTFTVFFLSIRIHVLLFLGDFFQWNFGFFFLLVEFAKEIQKN